MEDWIEERVGTTQMTKNQMRSAFGKKFGDNNVGRFDSLINKFMDDED